MSKFPRRRTRLSSVANAMRLLKVFSDAVSQRLGYQPVPAQKRA